MDIGKPAISIIVPIYNVEPHLYRCLDSILVQTFTDFELILVDDGSPDNCGEICNVYAQKDSRVKVIHKENAGVSKARNDGLDIATGEYVAFVDSDDYVDADYLSVMYKAIYRDDSDMAICGVRYRNSHNLDNFNEQFHIDDITLDKKNFSQILGVLYEKRRMNYIYSKLYKRQLLITNKVKFNIEMTLGEDTIFVCDVLKYTERISIIGGCYYNYIQYPAGTLTTQYYKNTYEIYLFIAQYIEQTMLDIGCFDNVMLNVIDDRKVISAIWSISSIRNQKHIKLFKKIILIGLVINNQEFKHSLKRRKDIYKQKEIVFMGKGNPIILMLYYWIEPRKLKAKGFVRELMPDNLAMWCKKWILK